jgi:hypothetical protein
MWQKYAMQTLLNCSTAMYTGRTGIITNLPPIAILNIPAVA